MDKPQFQHRDFCMFLAKSYNVPMGSTLVVQMKVPIEEWETVVDRTSHAVCVLSEGHIHRHLNPRENIVVALYWNSDKVTREEFIW